MLTIDKTTFRDAHGRHVLLRGVNFGGDCKLPATPNGHTHLPSDFRDHRTVSFIGRPAPLDEIDSHFARMAHWGFNCLRLLTTWEAVEHAGPGEYDEAYLDYFAEVCRRAGDHGLHVFIDFHQDVWSRMTGGDGAPGWTFEAAGLDFSKLNDANAALTMQQNYDRRIGGRQPSYPRMSWPSNYAAPANGIMWTLFFAGQDFAPSCTVDGQNIQPFLQNAYFGAVGAIAERIADLDNVLGFDTLNEPGTGYIGKGLDQRIIRGQGLTWTPLEGLAVASGAARELPVFEVGKGFTGTRQVNADRVSIWLPGRSDPFREAGVWESDAAGAATPLKPDYFKQIDGRAVDCERDYMVPFFNRLADTVRNVRPDWLIFAEVDPFVAATVGAFPEGMPDRTVNASHWYDITALMTKRFSTEKMVHAITGKVREGRDEIEQGYLAELSIGKRLGDALNGGAPTLIGECGIQFDMNDAQSYARWAAGERGSEIWQQQITALELMYNVFDALLLSSTQWNYTVSNSNDPMIGDGWNQEDLSIWSVDQAIGGDDPNSGGRAIEGFCRPFVHAAQGHIVGQRFDRASGAFEAVIEIDPEVTAPTEVYVPAVQYPDGVRWTVSSGTAKMHGQRLTISDVDHDVLTVTLSRPVNATNAE